MISFWKVPEVVMFASIAWLKANMYFVWFNSPSQIKSLTTKDPNNMYLLHWIGYIYLFTI